MCEKHPSRVAKFGIQNQMVTFSRLLYVCLQPNMILKSCSIVCQNNDTKISLINISMSIYIHLYLHFQKHNTYYNSNEKKVYFCTDDFL